MAQADGEKLDAHEWAAILRNMPHIQVRREVCIYYNYLLYDNTLYCHKHQLI